MPLFSGHCGQISQGIYYDDWYVELSYGPRWITYAVGFGGMAVLIFLAFRLMNCCQHIDNRPEAQYRGTGSERAPLFSQKDGNYQEQQQKQLELILAIAKGTDISRSEDDGSYDSEDGLPPLEENLNHLNSEKSGDEESETSENVLPLEKNVNHINLDESEDERSCDSDSGLPSLENNLNHMHFGTLVCPMTL